MNVVGLTDDGATAFVQPLPHGGDPAVVAFDRGYVTLRPLAAVRDETGELALSYAVRPATDEVRPPQQARGQDARLDLTTVTELEVRQRVAAYALVTSSLGLLATEFSDRTSVPGRWGLPGGGIETDEQPSAAVLREVVEETRQDVVLAGLVEVQTSHWIGRSPRDTIEDYHAVRLVYEATCQYPTPPEVLDVGGTTESARWIATDQWMRLDWTAGWRQILQQRLPG